MPEDDEKLIQRLAIANTRRRQQFEHWKRHHEKRVVATALVREEITTREITEQDPYPQVKTIGLLMLPDVASQAYSRPTTATELKDPNLIRFDDTASTATGRSITPQPRSGDADDEVSIPDPPSIQQDSKYFNCPYCFTICPASTLRKQSWREHVLKDLRPYICTYGGCKEERQLFDNWSDWIRHEQWDQNRVWRCPEHEKAIFLTAESFIQHLKAIHAQHELVSETVTASTSVSAKPERCCPVCLHTASTLDALQRHIGTHLQRIALFALPRLAQADTSQSQGSMDSAKYANDGEQDSRFDDLEEVTWDDELDVIITSEQTESPNSTTTDEIQTATLDPYSERTQSLETLTSAPNELEQSDSYDRETLCKAASNGDVARVRWLLDNGVEIGNGEYDDADTYSPMFWAIINGHEAVLRLLLDRGAEVNAIDGDGQTLLHIAAKIGHEPEVRLLLEQGADTNAENHDTKMPLHLAAENGHEAVARLLLDKGAEAEATDIQIETPLHLAAERGHKNATRLLLQRGAELNARETHQKTPLHLAVQHGHEAVTRLLLDNGAEAEATDIQIETPLHLAAEYGHGEVFRSLLEKGANVNAESHNERTPLHQAAEYGHEAIVRLLLENGADIEAVYDITGETPLHLAAKKGHKEVTRLLLEKGANIETVRFREQTPLHQAAQYGHEAVVRLLLENGADIEAVYGRTGETSLYLAAEKGHEATARLLLEKGANIHATDEDGSTPLQLAANNSRLKTLVSSALR